MAFLKQKNFGYKSKKSCDFSIENIEEFLKNAPDDMLPSKVALITLLMFLFKRGNYLLVLTGFFQHFSERKDFFTFLLLFADIESH